MQSLRKYALLAVGWISLGLGALGLVMPVLPTAPFILLAAACFLRSSERMHAWLVGHPVLGCHIRDYLSGRGLRRETKRAALVTLWVSVAFSTWLFIPLPLADVLVVAAAAAVTVYLLRLPTCAGNGASTPTTQDI